jgi:hypothetical protein
MRQKYIIEVRDSEGKLDFKKEEVVRKAHPYLFKKPTYSIDELCYYMSFGQGRNQPSGPMQLSDFMKSINVSYRVKYW